MSRLLVLFVASTLSILPITAPQAQAPTPSRPPQPAGDDTARIHAWFEAKFKEQLAFSPIQQTFLGQKSRELDDMSMAGQDKVLAWQRASTAEMRKSFDYSKLSPEAQTSYDAWIYQLEQAESAARFRKVGRCMRSGSRVRCPAPTRIPTRNSDASVRKSGGPSVSSSTPDAQDPGATAQGRDRARTPLRHPRIPRHRPRRRSAAADGAREAHRPLDRRSAKVNRR